MKPRRRRQPSATENDKQTLEPPVSWSHEGITYLKGDPLKIEGFKRTFTFCSVDIGGRSGKETVTVLSENGFRSFYADRVLPYIESKKKIKVCDEHPWYEAKRRTNRDCESCQLAYERAKEK